MTLFAALCLVLSACATTERTINVPTPDVPKTLLACGDENSPTKDGVPAPPKQPYDQREVAAYIVKLKAIIRECHGNKNAVQKLLDEFQAKATELTQAGH
ncbi:hypothetical protein GOC13_07105 [Sinorhizobium meliloti]|nr:hypothetical protein [Sinorhizobium meliloti]